MKLNWKYLLSAVLVWGFAQAEAQSGTEQQAGQSPGAIDAETEIERAKSAIGVFAAALQSELKSAMKEGGPVNAIGVCNTEAMTITQAVATDQGLQLSRVSLRNRSPANAPLDWQKAVLKSFEVRKNSGENPASLTWHEITDVDGRQQFRFMKAIPTGPVCLQCHGGSIAPEVKARLDELYPQDKATGFETGDIRGAFVVTR
jgi:hypothetical protein